MNRSALLISFLFIFLISCKKEIFQFNFSEKKKFNINDLDFENFQAKSRIDYDDGFQNFNANVNVRIKKDSVIWLSVTASIGIEAIRAIIRTDSIFVIDRINKEYNAFGFDSLQRKLNIPIDYNMLQSALVGNLINNREKEDRVLREGGFFLLKQNSGHFLIDNFVNSRTMKVEKVLIREQPSMNSLEINYDDFQFIGNKLLPHEHAFNISYTKNNYNTKTELSIGFNKVSVDDKKIKFPFNIPNKYVTHE
ncbi:MAG: DUF4292 domain-containing protein [Cyclobacteriaceae bacterium]|nr:DUF4292 domain-containing protein [Cyclobacteriaceae bacterium]